METNLPARTGQSDESAWYWRAAAASAAVLLWLQTGARPAAVEFLSGAPSPLYLGVDLLPLVVVAVACLRASPAVWLFAVPVSFVLLFASLPPRDAASLATPLRLAGIGATIATLIGTSIAASGRSPDLEAVWRAAGRTEGRRPEGWYAGFVALRVGWVVLFFVLLCAAPLLWAPPPDGGAGANAAATRLFLSVIGLFVWSVVAFTSILGPLSGLEYEVRQLENALDDAESRRRFGWRSALWAGAALVAVGASFAMNWIP